MVELRLKREQADYSDMSEHLDQQFKLYERNLHIKSSLRMQELLNAESFRKWKKLRSGDIIHRRILNRRTRLKMSVPDEDNLIKPANPIDPKNE